jgi:hypothetical protein
LGANRLDGSESGSLILDATATIVHEQYTSNNLNNVIALIQLPIDITFTREYCHVMTNIKIILYILEKIKCFIFATQLHLFISSMWLNVYQSFEY